MGQEKNPSSGLIVVAAEPSGTGRLNPAVHSGIGERAAFQHGGGRRRRSRRERRRRARPAQVCVAHLERASERLRTPAVTPRVIVGRRRRTPPLAPALIPARTRWLGLGLLLPGRNQFPSYSSWVIRPSWNLRYCSLVMLAAL